MAIPGASSASPATEPAPSKAAAHAAPPLAGGDDRRDRARDAAVKSFFLRAPACVRLSRRPACRRAADRAGRLPGASAAIRSPRRRSRRRRSSSPSSGSTTARSRRSSTRWSRPATRSSCADRSAVISSGEPEDGGPLLLVGGGSGVVPLMSMLRHRAARRIDACRRCLLFSARTWDDVIFRDELLALDGQRRRLRARPHADPRGAAAARRLRPSRRCGDDAGDGRAAARPPREVFICGVNGFVNAAADGAIGRRCRGAHHPHRTLRRAAAPVPAAKGPPKMSESLASGCSSRQCRDG